VLNFEGKAVSSDNSVDIRKRESSICLFMSSGYVMVSRLCSVPSFCGWYTEFLSFS
jgi:hypothetical protein